MNHYPTEFEIVDDADDVVAKVEMFDNVSAEVKLISTLHTVESWDELSAQIRVCLVKLELE